MSGILFDGQNDLYNGCEPGSSLCIGSKLNCDCEDCPPCPSYYKCFDKMEDCQQYSKSYFNQPPGLVNLVKLPNLGKDKGIKQPNQVCISQTTFDLLLEKALQNCQN